MQANFCLNCGHALEWREMGGVDRRACPHCDFVHWGSYSIGVGALVMKDERVLLVQRAQEPGKGNWTTPGGYAEQLEGIEQTIEREVLEETGVRARSTGIVAIRDLPRQIHNVYIAFAMEYVTGEPVADGVEVDGAGFFSLKEMESMKVASLTKWLVDIALTQPSPGLIMEEEPLDNMIGYGLFRIK
jgi:ADP-ribose pyrophosphatase YjhB (NUDIX family)